MAKTFSADVTTQLNATNFLHCELVEFNLDTPLYLTTAQWNITASTDTSGGSQTYLAQGNFLGFSSLTETTELRVNNVTLTFSAATTTFVNIALSDNYLHRPIRIYKAFFNTSTLALISSPFLIYDGTITGVNISDTATDTLVTFDTSNQFYDFDRIAGRRTNSGSNRRFFPADRGLDFSTTEINDIRWGRV